MAGAAKTHEVVVCMSAAFGHRQNVMHLFSQSHPSLGIAPLTIGVGKIISITDALPASSVFLVDIR